MVDNRKQIKQTQSQSKHTLFILSISQVLVQNAKLELQVLYTNLQTVYSSPILAAQL